MKWEGETSQLHPNRPYSQILVQENNGAEDGSAKRSLSSSSRDFPETSFALDLFWIQSLFWQSCSIHSTASPLASVAIPSQPIAHLFHTAALTILQPAIPFSRSEDSLYRASNLWTNLPASLPKSYPQWWSQTSMNTCVKKRRDWEKTMRGRSTGNNLGLT